MLIKKKIKQLIHREINKVNIILPMVNLMVRMEVKANGSILILV